ncbi:MAG: Mini-ribonuclease 3 [Ruminococcaceae bacterium]|nr:Mini-ribonuclease 3 [Oscillospiraceae bacterium]
MNPYQSYSSLTLAYVGDAIYEVFIRTKLTENGDKKVNRLHKEAKNFVSAKAQSQIVEVLLNSLTDDETDIFKRGRNTKVNTKAKNADFKEYHNATGLEALFGYLYLSKDQTRLNELMEQSYQIARELIGEA